MLVWRSILDGLEGGKETAVKAGRWYRAWEWSINRKRAVQILAEGVQEVLGDGFGYAWASPDPGFVNKRKKGAKKATHSDAPAPWLTPAASPEAEPVKDTSEVAEEKSLPLR